MGCVLVKRAIRITHVAAAGEREITGFWDGHGDDGHPTGGYGTFKIPTFPKTAEHERFAVLVHLVGRVTAAQLLGVESIEVHRLISGMSTTDEWDEVFRRLEKARRT
jgi:hypothetical protein